MAAAEKDQPVVARVPAPPGARGPEPETAPVARGPVPAPAAPAPAPVRAPDYASLSREEAMLELAWCLEPARERVLLALLDEADDPNDPAQVAAVQAEALDALRELIHMLRDPWSAAAECNRLLDDLEAAFAEADAKAARTRRPRTRKRTQ